MELVDAASQAGIIVMDKVFRPETDVQDDITGVLRDRQAEFETDFDEAKDSVKDQITTIQTNFDPEV